MADEPLTPDDELDADEPLEPTETEQDDPPTDADLAADNDPNDDQVEDDAGPAQPRRGPDASQRDRRLTRQEEFDRAVERAVERRLGRQVQQPSQVDWAAQQRELQARRQQELDAARLESPERYADVATRHAREDFEFRERAREMRDADFRQSDKWDRLCERYPVYDNLRDEVEREVNRLKANGIYAPDRQLLADSIFGRRQIERMGRVRGQQQRRADDATRSRTVRNPANPAGQVPAARRRGGRNFADLSVSEMEAQLGNMPVRTSSSS